MIETVQGWSCDLCDSVFAEDEILEHLKEKHPKLLRIALEEIKFIHFGHFGRYTAEEPIGSNTRDSERNTVAPQQPSCDVEETELPTTGNVSDNGSDNVAGRPGSFPINKRGVLKEG